MKIIHVIGSCVPGGAENFVKDLLIELKSKGMDVELLVMTKMQYKDKKYNLFGNFESEYVDTLNKNNISVKFINKRPHKDWFYLIDRINSMINYNEIDIIHVHLPNVAFHMCRALHKTGIPIVQTIHSENLSFRLIQKYYLKKRCVRFVVFSNKIASIVKQKISMDDEKISIISNGIRLSNYKAKDNGIKTVKNIIAIGRITEAKDYETLLAAFKILVDNLKNHGINIPTLNIAGTGEKEKISNLIQICKNFKIDNYVHFLGLRNDVPSLLSSADMYVMSSKWEGMPIALLEALASGLPMVVTDVGSNREIIEGDGYSAGILVPPSNPSVLASAMYKLIKDPLLRNKLSRLAVHRSKAFSISTSAAKHIEMYKGLLNKTM